MRPEFTDDELREVNDALNRYVRHMIEVGQTPQEIRYRSLETAWRAQQKTIAILMPGIAPPEWVKDREARVKDAISRPIRLQESDQT